MITAQHYQNVALTGHYVEDQSVYDLVHSNRLTAWARLTILMQPEVIQMIPEDVQRKLMWCLITTVRDSLRTNGNDDRPYNLHQFEGIEEILDLCFGDRTPMLAANRICLHYVMEKRVSDPTITKFWKMVQNALDNDLISVIRKYRNLVEFGDVHHNQLLGQIKLAFELVNQNNSATFTNQTSK